jgi:hypothetical protein
MWRGLSQEGRIRFRVASLSLARGNLTRADRVKAGDWTTTDAAERALITHHPAATGRWPNRLDSSMLLELETIRSKMAGCLAKPGRWT